MGVLRAIPGATGSATAAAVLGQGRAASTKVPATLAATAQGQAAPAGKTADKEARFRETFDQFVGETYYGQMLKSMRSTVKKPAYVYGGQAEAIFTQQLDQVLAEKMSHRNAGQFSRPMLSLYNLQRK